MIQSLLLVFSIVLPNDVSHAVATSVADAESYVLAGERAQAVGANAEAIRNYMTGVTRLTDIKTHYSSRLDTSRKLDIADYLMFALTQVAVLQHAHQDARPFLLRAYSIAREEMPVDCSAADLFVHDKSLAGFSRFSTLVQTNAPPRGQFARSDALADALQYGATGQLRKALDILNMTLDRDFDKYGDSEPLFFKGEVLRALGDEKDARKAFWDSIASNSTGITIFGLVRGQVLSAGALAISKTSP